ncbi:oxidoreductase, partial [Candidatus Epulonipiscium fishelsonii]
MIKHISELKYVPAMPSDCKARPIYIIGAGEIIVDAQAPAYILAGYPMKGIYNRTVATAHKVAKQFNIENVYEDLDEMIKDCEKNNGVYDIALPANLTATILRKLPNGSGVLVQKPMGESIQEAKEILDICHEKNLTAGVNFQLRQSPYMLQLNEMIKDGLIGEIYDLDWRVVTLQPWHLWTFLQSKERCEINYHSIHYVDAVRSILGEPTSVWCKTMKSPKAPELTQTASTIILNYGDTIRANI